MPKCIIDPASTIYEPKKKIKAQISVEVYRQTLSYRDTLIKNFATLWSYRMSRDFPHMKLTLEEVGQEKECHVLVKYTLADGKKREDLRVVRRFTVDMLRRLVFYGLYNYNVIEESTIKATDGTRWVRHQFQ